MAEEGQQRSDGELLNKVIQATHEKIEKQPLGQPETGILGKLKALGHSRTENPRKGLHAIAGIEEGSEQRTAVVDRVLQEDRAKRAEQQQLVAEARADPRHQKVMEQAQQDNASKRAAVEQHQAEQRGLAAEARGDPRHQQAIDRALQQNPIGKQDASSKHRGVHGALHRGIARVKGLVGRNK